MIQVETKKGEKNMTQTLKNKKGVTLVELLAVIVILGIIAAIAVPAIGGLIERQQERAAEASFTSVEQASRTYALSESPDVNFTMDDLVPDYLDKNPFDLTYGALTILLSEIEIDVTGNVVTFYVNNAAWVDGTELTIDGFDVGVGVNQP